MPGCRGSAPRRLRMSSYTAMSWAPVTTMRSAITIVGVLDKWAPLVSLSSQPIPTSPAAQIPQLAVDTTSATAPGLAADIKSSGAIRYLDMEPLSKTLRQTINLLKQGQTPGQLGLGDDARQPGCENLIMLLYLQWCQIGRAHV